jgi:TPR repeat protein
MNPGGNQAIYALVEKAAKMGNPRAQFSLGLMNYRIGDLSFDTANGNLDEALLWYRPTAEQGDVDSESCWRLLTPRASASPGVRSKLTNGMTLQRRLPNIPTSRTTS